MGSKNSKVGVAPEQPPPPAGNIVIGVEHKPFQPISTDDENITAIKVETTPALEIEAPKKKMPETPEAKNEAEYTKGVADSGTTPLQTTTVSALVHDHSSTELQPFSPVKSPVANGGPNVPLKTTLPSAIGETAPTVTSPRSLGLGIDTSADGHERGDASLRHSVCEGGVPPTTHSSSGPINDACPQLPPQPASSPTTAATRETEAESAPRSIDDTSAGLLPDQTFGGTWNDWDDDDDDQNGAVANVGTTATNNSRESSSGSSNGELSTHKSCIAVASKSTGGGGLLVTPEKKRGAPVMVSSPSPTANGGDGDDDDDWDAPAQPSMPRPSSVVNDDNFDDWDDDDEVTPAALGAPDALVKGAGSSPSSSPSSSSSSSVPPPSVAATGGIIVSSTSLAPGEVSALAAALASGRGGGAAAAGVQPDSSDLSHQATLGGSGFNSASSSTSSLAFLGSSPHWDEAGSLPPLFCQSCGFDVLRFRACRWSTRCGYMHFRNFNGHSLDGKKLAQALVVAPRSAAYACQCAWQSIGGDAEQNLVEKEGEGNEAAAAAAAAGRRRSKKTRTEGGGGGGDEKATEGRGTRKDLSAWGTDPGAEGGAANGSLRWVKRKQRPLSQQ